MIISGWFEPAARFEGVQELWALESSKFEGIPLLAPHGVKFEAIGGWKCVLYSNGAGLAPRLNINAHWVELETWIELHISAPVKTSPEEAERAARELLMRLEVKPFKPRPEGSKGA